ncbi:unnamed protein product [Dovyalis caffra]|uniref:MADS-box domain-containing protein n=1 Tax=Dovyalis caffra TaxID=77055 RepID=A0AAV1RWA1_9ROSI|nr:unnamed protein product [Dovyalis caffra]
MASKKTKGKQKLEIKRIENHDDRLVTFSKRRSGIYKKASELITLTGAEIAFVVFSPTGKPFSFAHPSVESIANRFLGKDPPYDNIHPLVEAYRQTRIEELNKKNIEMADQLDIDKEKGQKLKNQLEENESESWWDAKVQELNLQGLIELEAKFKVLHMTLCNKIMGNNNGAPSSQHFPSNYPPKIGGFDKGEEIDGFGLLERECLLVGGLDWWRWLFLGSDEQRVVLRLSGAMILLRMVCGRNGDSGGLRGVRGTTIQKPSRVVRGGCGKMSLWLPRCYWSGLPPCSRSCNCRWLGAKMLVAKHKALYHIMAPSATLLMAIKVEPRRRVTTGLKNDGPKAGLGAPTSIFIIETWLNVVDGGGKE